MGIDQAAIFAFFFLVLLKTVCQCITVQRAIFLPVPFRQVSEPMPAKSFA